MRFKSIVSVCEKGGWTFSDGSRNSLAPFEVGVGDGVGEVEAVDEVLAGAVFSLLLTGGVLRFTGVRRAG